MKVKSLILAMAACAGLFTACSDEIDQVIGNGNETKADAYMTLVFTTPSSSGTGAAAGENGDGTQDAITGEYEINDANIFLFQDDLLKQIVTKSGKSITESDGSGNAQKVYTAEKVQVSTGTFKVYVVVNETTNQELTKLPTGTSLASFQAKVFAAAQTTGDYCRTGHFLMTNAFVMGNGDPAGTEGIVTITDDNTVDNPAKVSINVERAAAKIAMTIPTGQTVEIKNAGGEKIGTAFFKSYKVINTRNDAFFLKRVSASITDFTPTIGGDETNSGPTATNYVLENRFNEKSAFIGQKSDWEAAEGFYQKYYSRKYNTYVAWRKMESSENQTLAYCLENTMKQNDQVEGFVTTVIFRAIYTPEASLIKGKKPADWDGTFYRYPKGSGESVFYYTLQDLIDAIYGSMDEAKKQGVFGLTIDMDASAIAAHLSGITQKDLYETYSTEQYPQGYCYYNYIIRHANNNDNELRGVMEHVIVRNNVYQLAVNSVAGVGSISSGTNGPSAEDMIPDPNNPGQEIPGPGVDEPENGSNPEIPGVVDPEGPVEPETPIIPIDPETPTEQQKTYLEVSVKVLKWVLRSNNMDL